MSIMTSDEFKSVNEDRKFQHADIKKALDQIRIDERNKTIDKILNYGKAIIYE